MHISTNMRRSLATLAVVLVGGMALAATTNNYVPYAQSFEDTELWANDALVAGTNGWSAGADDKSTITNLPSGYSLPVGKGFPITNYNHTTDNRVINLYTDGAVLTNSFEATAESCFQTTPRYVDTMANFVLSEGAPSGVTNDVNIKAAVYVNENSNLVVYCGGYTNLPITFLQPSFLATDKKVVPATWYRLTIKLEATNNDETGFAAEAFQVLINGEPVWSGSVYTDWKTEVPTIAPTGGTWFLSAARWPAGVTGTLHTNITAVAFQGTGFIDDLVVGSDNPVYTAASFFITHNITGSGDADPLGPIEIAPNGSTQVVYTAEQWFRIGELKTNDVAIGDAVGTNTYTVAFDNVTEDYDVDVIFTNATAGQVGIPTSVDPDWANDYYPTEAAALADGSLATDYLLNLNPTVTYDIGLFFTTLTINGTFVTNTVTLMDGATNLTTTINGTLKIQGKEELTDAEWQDILGASFDNASFVDGDYVVGFTDETNKFFQAIITTLP